MTHQSNKGECCEKCYVMAIGRCLDPDCSKCHQPQTSQAYVDSRTPEERERDDKIKTHITYNEPPTQTSQECSHNHDKQMCRVCAPAFYEQLDSHTQRKEHECIDDGKGWCKICSRCLLVQRKETESWEEEFDLNTSHLADCDIRTIKEFITELLTKHTNEVLEKIKVGIEKIAFEASACINIRCDNNGVVTFTNSDGEPEQEQCEYCHRVRFPHQKDLSEKLQNLLHQHQVKEDI